MTRGMPSGIELRGCWKISCLLSMQMRKQNLTLTLCLELAQSRRGSERGATRVFQHRVFLVCAKSFGVSHRVALIEERHFEFSRSRGFTFTFRHLTGSTRHCRIADRSRIMFWTSGAVFTLVFFECSPNVTARGQGLGICSNGNTCSDPFNVNEISGLHFGNLRGVIPCLTDYVYLCSVGNVIPPGQQDSRLVILC